MKASSVRRWSARLVVAAVAGLAVPTLSAIPSAEARGTGAILGNPYLGSKSACFNEYFGGVVNGCPSAEYWAIPAILDGDGPRTFSIRARGVADQIARVSCKAYATNADLSVTNWSSEVQTVRSDGAVELLQPSVTAPGWGAYHAFCRMDTGTTILNMHYGY